MPEEIKEFNQAEYLETRNKAEADKLAGKVVESVSPGVEQPKHVEDEGASLRARDRRALNKAREEAAELRGRLSAFEGLAKKEPVQAAAGDPEPQRKDYPEGAAGDASYNRAAGRWDARQETQKVLSEKTQSETQKAEWDAFIAVADKMDAKAQEDRKVFDDFDEVVNGFVEESEEDPSLQFSAETHPEFVIANKQSKVKASLVYYYATHPDELRAVLKLKGNKLFSAFRDLEIEAAIMYASKQKQKEVVQASPGKTGKERTAHPADSDNTDGRNANDGERRKPRPSSEVAARGGTSTPDKPAPGSAAWFEQRNRMQYGPR